MYEKIESPKENKSRSVAKSVAQKKHNGKQKFGFMDNRPEGKQAAQLQGMISDHQHNQIKSVSIGGDVTQRLAMKYGNSAPIPQDAQKIADGQNGTRGEDIAVQTIPGAVPENVYDAMGDNEKVYIVAHGRAPLGSEPAILQDGNGGTLSGSHVASIINNLKTGLSGKNKTIGTVKIEACMSSLSRKTERGFWGETFVTAKPSLMTDIKTSLASTYNVDGITVQGNLGFSTGNEFEDGGVKNLSPKNTEVGLLAAVLETLYAVSAKDWNTDPNKALKKDGINIVKKYGTALAAFDRDSQVSQLISTSTAVLVNSYLNANTKSNTLNGDVINVVSLLNGYVRKDPD